MSFLSGFASGVVGAAELYKCGYINKRQTEALCAVCDNTGPALPCFIIGMSCFNSLKIGAAIYIIQILSSLAVCVSVKENSFNNDFNIIQSNKIIFRCITDSVEGSIKSISVMCGYVILFTVIGDAIKLIPILKSFLPYLEIVSGVSTLTGNNFGFNFIIASSALSFGGICVHLQAASICNLYDISMKKHFAYKILQSLISAVFSAVYILIINKSIF